MMDLTKVTDDNLLKFQHEAWISVGFSALFLERAKEQNDSAKIIKYKDDLNDILELARAMNEEVARRGLDRKETINTEAFEDV